MGASTLTKRQSFDLSVRQVVREYEVVADILDEVIDENRKLQNENARLLSCLHDDGENAALVLGENGRLRDLARRLYLQLLNAYDPRELEEFADEMRGLGVDAWATT